MTLLILSYLAGALTIVAPCILPVVPFVFSSVDRPFVRSGLPLLAGMVVSFAGVATLALVGGSWAVHANEMGRTVALLVLGAMGLALLLPALAERSTRPLVALGSRLTDRAQASARTTGRSMIPSFALGAATGLLWAPCAGPVLGLVLTTAALQGASTQTTLLLVAYAAGAATSLGLALWAGGRVFAAMKRTFRIGEWLRRGVGFAVIASVAAVSLGLDTGLLARLTPASTDSIERELLQQWSGRPVASSDPSAELQPASYSATTLPTRVADAARPRTPLPPLPVEGQLPDLAGATTWLNSPPLTPDALRGKVVLVDFWTFACVNCQRALPYVRTWAQKYRNEGLVVIGVHSPEFAFEHDIGNVKRAADKLDLHFPIAIDNGFAIWRAFSNQYWPAHYFVDAQGRIRFHHFGEGEYERSEQVIRQLLDEARQQPDDGGHRGAGKTTASTTATAGRPTDAVASRESLAMLATARFNDKERSCFH